VIHGKLLLFALGGQPQHGSLAVLKVVFGLQIQDSAEPAAGVGQCSDQGIIPTISDVSGVDWTHNVQARLYASAGVFTVAALKRD